MSTRPVPVAAAILAAASLVLAACAPVAAPDTAPSEAARGTVGDAPATSSTLDDADRPGLVVTIGDSIMAGLGVDPDDAWPALLAASNGADIVNLGCSGAGFVAVGDCGTDFDGLVDQAIALQPDLVIVQSSDNDLDSDEGDITAATRAAIDRLRTALPRAQIVGIGTLWQLDGDEPDAIGWSTSALRDAVEEDDGVFVSIGQPLRDRPDLLQWDGEHPNESGQRVLSEAVSAALSRAGIAI